MSDNNNNSNLQITVYDPMVGSLLQVNELISSLMIHKTKMNSVFKEMEETPTWKYINTTISLLPVWISSKCKKSRLATLLRLSVRNYSKLVDMPETQATGFGRRDECMWIRFLMDFETCANNLDKKLEWRGPNFYKRNGENSPTPTVWSFFEYCPDMLKNDMENNQSPYVLTVAGFNDKCRESVKPVNPPSYKKINYDAVWSGPTMLIKKLYNGNNQSKGIDSNYAHQSINVDTK